MRTRRKSGPDDRTLKQKMSDLIHPAQKRQLDLLRKAGSRSVGIAPFSSDFGRLMSDKEVKDLKALEKAGLVESRFSEGGNYYVPTDAGRELLAEREAKGKKAPREPGAVKQAVTKLLDPGREARHLDVLKRASEHFGIDTHPGWGGGVNGKQDAEDLADLRAAGLLTLEFDGGIESFFYRPTEAGKAALAAGKIPSVPVSNKPFERALRAGDDTIERD